MSRRRSTRRKQRNRRDDDEESDSRGSYKSDGRSEKSDREETEDRDDSSGYWLRSRKGRDLPEVAPRQTESVDSFTNRMLAQKPEDPLFRRARTENSTRMDSQAIAYPERSRDSLNLQRLSSKDDLVGRKKNPREEKSRCSLRLVYMPSKDDYYGTVKNPKQQRALSSASLMLREVASKDDLTGSPKNARPDDNQSESSLQVTRVSSKLDRRNTRKRRGRPRKRRGRTSSRVRARSPLRVRLQSPDYNEEDFRETFGARELSELEDPLGQREIIRSRRQKRTRTKSEITLGTQGSLEQVDPGMRETESVDARAPSTRRRRTNRRRPLAQTLQEIERLKAELETQYFQELLDENLMRKYLTAIGAMNEPRQDDDFRERGRFIFRVANLARALDGASNIEAAHIVYAVWCHEHKLFLEDDKLEKMYKVYKQEL